MKFKPIFSASFLLLVGLNLAGRVAARQEQEPAPAAIIKRMAERYASAATYQDTGVVEFATDGPLPTRGTSVTFKTYFSRPRKLRFEWVDLVSTAARGRSAVWSDGTKTFSYYSFEPGAVEEKENLEMGLAGATGISLGSAWTVPDLLLKGAGGFSLTELERVSLKGRERFEGADCFVLEGFHPNGEPWRLWVGRDDFFLRKLAFRRDNGALEEEIHRDIRVGELIPDETYRLRLKAGVLAPDAISKGKEEDLRRLVSILLPRERLNLELKNAIDLLKEGMPQVPEKVWKEVTDELRLDSDALAEVYVSLFDGYYTADEVKRLLTFYETPLGKKVVRNSTLIEMEAARYGEAAGREIVNRIKEKLRAKGIRTPTT